MAENYVGIDSSLVSAGGHVCGCVSVIIINVTI